MTQAAVHLVDDEAAVRDALRFLFESHGLTVQAYDGGAPLLQAVDAGAFRGCILLDVRMEPISGLQVHDELMRRGIQVPVIFLSGHGDIRMAVDALKKGAFDFVEKPFSDDVLVERVREAMQADTQIQEARSRGRQLEMRLAALTQREREVMRRVAAGSLNKQIAAELNVSMRTVEVYRSRVFDKLGVRSAAELATLLAGAFGEG